jgi:hypothetical protein
MCCDRGAEASPSSSDDDDIGFGVLTGSDCRYQKGLQTCTEPHHFSSCSLPHHVLRNGHLNQTEYSLYLFIRDVADGDLVAWIDQQLTDAASKASPDRVTASVCFIGRFSLASRRTKQVAGLKIRSHPRPVAQLLCLHPGRKPLFIR